MIIVLMGTLIVTIIMIGFNVYAAITAGIEWLLFIPIYAILGCYCLKRLRGRLK